VKGKGRKGGGEVESEVSWIYRNSLLLLLFFMLFVQNSLIQLLVVSTFFKNDYRGLLLMFYI
jgi:hypothetical protein